MATHIIIPIKDKDKEISFVVAAIIGVKLILIKLSDITEEEWAGYHKIEDDLPLMENDKEDDVAYSIRLNAAQINYLRKICIDCDGLIEKEMAIDAKTLK